jgi:hypothetical protein
VASQWAGGAVRENEVLFSVFFIVLLCVVSKTVGKGYNLIKIKNKNSLRGPPRT